MQESGQTYLEIIYLLQRETTGRVRAIDVANALSFSKPSVSRAMGKLRELGYLEEGTGTSLVLTKEGTKLAKSLVDRQETITQFLMMTADVDQSVAEEDAKKMMHFLSDKTFKGIKSFIKQVEELND
ncbi:MAG: metal-dependent transcriptional regulator [Lachnospiraceae bacterium]|nr:metal-dependent transcriptional regulator [Lachnospiraceae bacterium]